MVDRVIKIQEQQLHNSCPIATQIQIRETIICNLESQIENLKGQLKEQEISTQELKNTNPNRRERVDELEGLIANVSHRIDTIVYDLQNI